MSHQPVGIRSLAVSFPHTVRTNDYWRQNHPELIAQAEQKSLSKAFSIVESNSNIPADDLWSQEMIPYLSDPFRGTVERRVLAPGESSLDIEYQAAKEALNAIKLDPEEIDLMLVASMFPEQIAPGNASFLSGRLGLRGAAWNIESTCTSAIVAFQTACGLVRAGEYRHVLVVTSTTFSRFVDESDTLSFLTGDGAGAFVVSSLKTDQGILGTKIIHTAETCGAFFNELTTDTKGNPRMVIRAGESANKMFRHTFVESCRTCCDAALKAAGIAIEQIDFLISNTNTAWYSDVYRQALGIEKDRTINLNSQYANIGSTSPIANLYHAAQEGKIRENDLVLIYTFGATGTAGATIMRWGDVGLGSTPAPAANSPKAMAAALR